MIDPPPLDASQITTIMGDMLQAQLYLWGGGHPLSAAIAQLGTAVLLFGILRLIIVNLIKKPACYAKRKS